MLLDIVFFLYVLLCIVCFVIVGERTFHTITEKRIKYFIAFAICMIVLIPYAFGRYSMGMHFIYMCLILTVYIIMFQESIGLRIIHFFQVFLLEMVMEIVFINIFNMVLGDIVKEEWKELFGMILAMAVLWWITDCRWYKNTITYLSSLTKRQYIAIVIIMLGGAFQMAALNSARHYITNQGAILLLYTFSIVYLIAVLIGIIWFVKGIYSKEYYYKQNQQKEEIIDTQQKYFQAVYEKDREIRRFRHDISAQLGILRMLFEKGDLSAAQEHLTDMENEFSKTVAIKYHLGNDVLDVIVNQMYLKAKEKNIRIEVDGVIKDFKEINTYDLCTIFSNALSNAIEACENMNSAEKVIKVSLLEHNKTLLCRFINPATYEMYQAVSKKNTTKSDIKNHGFGVGNIYMAVEKNGGEVNYFFDEGELCLEIYL